MTNADRVWNRAAMEAGGDSPGPGDRALAALLYVHGLIMNGGVHHAIECADEVELAAAADGYTFFGLDDVAELLRSTSTDPALAAWTDDNEVLASGRYAELIPDDSYLGDRFEEVLKARPEQFAPLEPLDTPKSDAYASGFVPRPFDEGSPSYAHLRTLILTSLAMLAFAGNSLLCRAALQQTTIDAASFTTIRLLAGALMLWLVVQMGQSKSAGEGSWLSAFALFIYAAGFSFAYESLTAATGALLLFGAVQATMIGYGLWAGERLLKLQIVGLLLALAGLTLLLLPGFSAPSLQGSVLMAGAGIAWGVYSLRGKGAGDPTAVTAGNFLRAVPIAAALSVTTLSFSSLDTAGLGYALASGALTSGIGYAIWYTALPALRATQAATVQLSVPAIAALGGVVLLGEPVTLRLVLASGAILGGIALVTLKRIPVKEFA